VSGLHTVLGRFARIVDVLAHAATALLAVALEQRLQFLKKIRIRPKCE